ncbi:MAG: ice-binding family protein [Polyangia bacterium]
MRSAITSCFVLLPLLFGSACNTGGGATADLSTAGSTDLGKADLATSAPDMTVYNPPNPVGAGPAPIAIGTSTDLASAGAYVLLAKTGVTNVTGSAITGGNVGLSPAAATFLTGFSEAADPSTQFSTSDSVVAPGKIYAANYGAPTPANLTSAVLSMQTAYNDAASRNPPDHLNLSSGDLGGLVLAPGLYTWGSTVTIPTAVTLAGGANDVWIFQISNDLDLSTATNVVLSGEAQAKNIFWQVAGKVTIHANAHFEGIILCKTAITLQTKATMNGRALAQSLIALDNNAVPAP